MLIDIKVNEKYVDQLRLPIIGSTIPMVLRKYKRIDKPFSYSVDGEMGTVEEHLTAEEERLILEFCSKIGLDCGELDVLRSRDDGRIYIVDANNTPCQHFAGYSKKEARFQIKGMSNAFDAAFSKDWRK